MPDGYGENVDLNLKDVLIACIKLESMATEYETFVGMMSDTAGNDVYAFESESVYNGWDNLRNLIWDIAADTQNNLNDTATVLRQYINAVCAEDEHAAEQLLQDVGNQEDAYDDSSGNQGDIVGVDLEDEELNPDNPDDGIVDVPEHDDGERSDDAERSEDRHWPTGGPN